jgi:hypothetical protein
MHISVRGSQLKLGFNGNHVDFSWRPYDKRRSDHQENYDRLIVSIFHNGVKMPLITYLGHVLIGMRRYEIAMRLNPDTVFDCVEILEDVNEWDRNDIPRLDALKKMVGEFKY